MQSFSPPPSSSSALRFLFWMTVVVAPLHCFTIPTVPSTTTASSVWSSQRLPQQQQQQQQQLHMSSVAATPDFADPQQQKQQQTSLSSDSSSASSALLPVMDKDGIYQLSTPDDHAALLRYAAEHKLMMVTKVYNPWCRACKGLEPKFRSIRHDKRYRASDSAANTATDAAPVLWAAMTAKHNKEYLQSLGVSAIPTVQFHLAGHLLEQMPCAPRKVPLLRQALVRILTKHVDGTTGMVSESSVAVAERASMEIQQVAAAKLQAKRDAEEEDRRLAAPLEGEAVDQLAAFENLSKALEESMASSSSLSSSPTAVQP